MLGEENSKQEIICFEQKLKVADCFLHLSNEVGAVLADSVIQGLCDHGEDAVQLVRDCWSITGHATYKENSEAMNMPSRGFDKVIDIIDGECCLNYR